MDATYIAILLQIAGWALFFRGAWQMRKAAWRRGPFILFWIAAALLGASTFCFAAAPLLNWSQIAYLMLTGGILTTIVAGVWGMFTAQPRIGPLKAAETERADLVGVKIRTTPRMGPAVQPIPAGRSTWTSATVRNIEAMEVNI